MLSCVKYLKKIYKACIGKRFCTTIAGFIGYSTGRLLDKFESFSDKKIDEFIENYTDGRERNG